MAQLFVLRKVRASSIVVVSEQSILKPNSSASHAHLCADPPSAIDVARVVSRIAITRFMFDLGLSLEVEREVMILDVPLECDDPYLMTVSWLNPFSSSLGTQKYIDSFV